MVTSLAQAPLICFSEIVKIYQWFYIDSCFVIYLFFFLHTGDLTGSERRERGMGLGQDSDWTQTRVPWAKQPWWAKQWWLAVLDYPLKHNAFTKLKNLYVVTTESCLFFIIVPSFNTAAYYGAIYGIQSSMSVQLFKEPCQKLHNTLTKQTSCPHVKGSER